MSWPEGMAPHVVHLRTKGNHVRKTLCSHYPGTRWKEVMTFLPHIREVPGSNLYTAPEDCDMDILVSVRPSCKCRYSTFVPMTASFHFFPNSTRCSLSYLQQQAVWRGGDQNSITCAWNVALHFTVKPAVAGTSPDHLPTHLLTCAQYCMNLAANRTFQHR